MINILEMKDLIDIGKTVCVVATGPNGADRYQYIPPNAFIIAVNGAIDIPDIEADLWMCVDLNVRKEQWFWDNLPGSRDIAVFSYSLGMAMDDEIAPRWFVKQGPQLEESDPEIHSNDIRTAVSVTGSAMQLAYNLGAKYISIIGADFSGAQYWNGTTARDAVNNDKNWTPAKYKLDRMIEWMIDRDISLESLSPTKLKIPQFTYDWDEWLAKEIKSPDKDMLRNPIETTSTIQIVAPGKGGSDYLSLLDPSLTTIVINKAIEIDCNADLWMVADSNAYEHRHNKCSWFQYGIDNHMDIACFDSGFLFEKYPDVPMTFEHGPKIAIDDCCLIPGFMRSGCSIGAQAIQMAFWLGADEIRLLGMDMSGVEYFDGTDAGAKWRNDGTWHVIKTRINLMLNWIRSRGVEVTSLSPTALDVEVLRCEPMANV